MAKLINSFLQSRTMIKKSKAVQRTAISPPLYFLNICFSLNLTGTLNLTKIVHYHWSRMGK